MRGGGERVKDDRGTGNWKMVEEGAIRHKIGASNKTHPILFCEKILFKVDWEQALYFREFSIHKFGHADSYASIQCIFLYDISFIYVLYFLCNALSFDLLDYAKDSNFHQVVTDGRMDQWRD